MIEVLFGESEAGAMRMAARKYKKKLGNDVICLAFLLDIGNIQEAVDSTYRKNFIFNFYAQEQWGKDIEMESSLRKAGEAYQEELDRFKQYLQNGESIRIWYSENPYSLCGFYQLCYLLQSCENKIFAVKLPEHVVKGNTVIAYQSWGEIEYNEFVDFLSFQKELAVIERRKYAFIWGNLVKDNSPLRAVINGKLVSVPENFYDFLIWEHLTDKPVTEARLIGILLGTYSLGISDAWYAFRIEYLIKQGKIKVVKDSARKYERDICLA